jgi:hypothetical protein
MNATSFRQQMCQILIDSCGLKISGRHKRVQAADNARQPLSAHFSGQRKWQINLMTSVPYRTTPGLCAQNSHRISLILLMLPLSPAAKDVKIDTYQLLNERNL